MLRCDADVLAFFRKTGKKYQSRMSAVLRGYMLAQKWAASKSAKSSRRTGQKRKVA